MDPCTNRSQKICFWCLTKYERINENKFRHIIWTSELLIPVSKFLFLPSIPGGGGVCFALLLIYVTPQSTALFCYILPITCFLKIIIGMLSKTTSDHCFCVRQANIISSVANLTFTHNKRRNMDHRAWNKTLRWRVVWFAISIWDWEW